MRQQELKNAAAFKIVGAPALAVQSVERPKPATAVPDMPRAAGVLMIGAYAALMTAFAVTIHGARADFAILISAFYIAMFFGVPAAILRTEHDSSRRPGLGEFLDRGMDTASGPIGGGGALVQMLIVPVLLVFAILAMGITYLLV
jgi:hypothetical protein